MVSDQTTRIAIASRRRSATVASLTRTAIGIAAESTLMQNFDAGALGEAELDQAALELALGQIAALVVGGDGVDAAAKSALGVAEQRRR